MAEGGGVGADVIIDPPETIEASRLAGRWFGSAWGQASRVAFEDALVAQLLILSEALATGEWDAEEAVAAFDQAAWSGWEAARPVKGMD